MSLITFTISNESTSPLVLSMTGKTVAGNTRPIIDPVSTNITSDDNGKLLTATISPDSTIIITNTGTLTEGTVNFTLSNGKATGNFAVVVTSADVTSITVEQVIPVTGRLPSLTTDAVATLPAGNEQVQAF